MTSDPVVNSLDQVPELRARPDAEKLVLGSLSEGEDVGALAALASLSLADGPKLEIVHLWGLEGLSALSDLPANLRTLDIRRCPKLEHLGPLPASLETLVIEGASGLRSIQLPRQLPHLFDLSLANCGGLKPEVVEQALSRSSKLQFVDLSGLEIPHLGWGEWDHAELEVLRANDCKLLQEWSSTAGEMPTRLDAVAPKLRRLEIRGSALESLPQFSEALDFVDVRGCLALREVPSLGLGRGLQDLPALADLPRTLFLHGSGVELDGALLGEADENVAPRIRAHFEGERTEIHEIKVIVLGNGGAGKSSLVNALLGRSLDPDEPSTHGIRHEPMTLERVKLDGGEMAESVDVHFWDFGGQDLYHHTHRLFYQVGAVFVVCEPPDASMVGHDAEDDERRRAAEPRDAAALEPQGFEYWREQIESIVPKDSPRSPQILRVRTKCDRANPSEPEGEPVADESVPDWIAFHAVEADCDPEERAQHQAEREDVLRALRGAIRRVLGPKSRREVASGVARVVEELVALGKESAARTVTMTDFGELATRYFRDQERSVYREQPALLAEYLHARGRVHFSRRHAPETIILDQRWAIEAIYTVLSRSTEKEQESCPWTELQAQGGRCTLADLRRWGWREERYEEHESLLLSFMESCGLMFRIGASYLRENASEEFVFPRALPSWNDGLRSHLDRETERFQREATIRIENVPRDRFLPVVAELGRAWGRSGEYWQWGGQVVSYDHHVAEAGVGRDAAPWAVRLDWEPDTSGNRSWLGTARILAFGEAVGVTQKLREVLEGVSARLMLEEQDGTTARAPQECLPGSQRLLCGAVLRT